MLNLVQHTPLVIPCYKTAALGSLLTMYTSPFFTDRLLLGGRDLITFLLRAAGSFRVCFVRTRAASVRFDAVTLLASVSVPAAPLHVVS
jgi:hypothetical protein